MVNVISVKWGNKYSSHEVNRLYRMVCKNLKQPFVFYCITEDAHGLDSDISVISNTLEYDLDGVWNKLLLFNPDYEPDGINLYLDIDLIIQRPIDLLIDFLSPSLTKVRAFWKPIDSTDGDYCNLDQRWDMNYNSSIMLWQSNSCTHIWDTFIADPDMYMIKYHGIDRFIYHEISPSNYFPSGIIYSRLYGIDLSDVPGPYYFPESYVCLFNGPTGPSDYDEFIKYM